MVKVTDNEAAWTSTSFQGPLGSSVYGAGNGTDGNGGFWKRAQTLSREHFVPKAKDDKSKGVQNDNLIVYST